MDSTIKESAGYRVGESPLLNVQRATILPSKIVPLETMQEVVSNFKEDFNLLKAGQGCKPLDASVIKHHTSKLKIVLIVLLVVALLSLGYGAYVTATNTAEQGTEKVNKNPYMKILRNPVDFLTTSVKEIFNKFMKPFIEFFHMLLEVIKDLVNSVKNIQDMIYYMRVSTRSFLDDIAQMLYNYSLKFSKLINRFMYTFHLLFKTFEDIFYGLLYGVFTVSTLWNGPVGGTARTLFSISKGIKKIVNWFCFHQHTEITMKDGSTKQIYKIKVGDNLKKGGEVLAVHKFSGKGCKLYLYKEKTIVSGSHLVKETSKWVRVNKSHFAKPLETEEEFIYCLTTKHGKIVSGNTIFADYMEIQNETQMKHIFSILVNHLNIKTATIPKQKVWGFHKNIVIGNKKISNIQIGEMIGNGNVVTGLSIMSGKNIPMYTFNNCVSSGNIIVDNNGWQFIKDIGTKTKNSDLLYHIFTTTGEFVVNGTKYKDYEQVHDSAVNNEIDMYVESVLKK